MLANVAIGVALGLVVPTALVWIGKAIDHCAPWNSQFVGSPFSRRFLAVMAVFTLSDEVTDLLSIANFYETGEFDFFRGAIALLLLSSVFVGYNSTGINGQRGSNSERFWLGTCGVLPFYDSWINLRRGGEQKDDGQLWVKTIKWVKLWEAVWESAPQFYLQMIFLTKQGWATMWDRHQIQLLSAVFSFVSLTLSFAGFYTATATHPDVGVAPAWKGSKQAMLACATYAASDLALRAIAIAVLSYAAGRWAAVPLTAAGLLLLCLEATNRLRFQQIEFLKVKHIAIAMLHATLCYAMPCSAMLCFSR
jgi:hypothetical protein